MGLVDRGRLLGDLEQLRAIGRRGRGVERPAFSADDVRAREWLVERMLDAGLRAGIDGVGNVVGYAPTARAVLAGSHSDTVPGGGWLDGALGVVAALEAARTVNAAASASGGLGVDVVSFADEEGTFRGTFGSRAFCGELGDAETAEATDGQGRILADVLAELGWADRPRQRLDPARHVAFVELHIEQGPVLEQHGQAVGIVSGIVGIRRIALRFHGRADHAGTTPMALRQDAGAAAIEAAGAFAALLAGYDAPDTVWNVGALQLHPGFGNVVPERADLTLEYRGLDEALLVDVDARLAAVVQAVAERHGVGCRTDVVARMPPLAMDPRLMDRLGSAAAALGVSSRTMPSGAGHDAMVVGRHVPTGMLFAPSIGGRSHHELEDTSPEDLVTATEVLTAALLAVCREDGGPR